MNKYIKISAIIFFGFLFTTSMAATRFIIKYKSLDNDSTDISSTHKDDTETDKIKSHPIKKIPTEKLAILSDKAKQATGGIINNVRNSYAIATGAFVIILDKNLDKNQTKNFIDSVKEDNDVKYIEEDRIMKIAHNKLK